MKQKVLPEFKQTKKRMVQRLKRVNSAKQGLILPLIKFQWFWGGFPSIFAST